MRRTPKYRPQSGPDSTLNLIKRYLVTRPCGATLQEIADSIGLSKSSVDSRIRVVATIIGKTGKAYIWSLRQDELTEFNFDRLQREARAWNLRNFGDHPYTHPLMGVSEEVGKLNHALLKQEQGIQGTKAQHESDAKDAVGDIIIFLADVCSCRGWSMQDIVESTWAEVKKRDWKKNPTDGTP